MNLQPRDPCSVIRIRIIVSVVNISPVSSVLVRSTTEEEAEVEEVALEEELVVVVMVEEEEVEAMVEEV